jgi:hypothetical protein
MDADGGVKDAEDEGTAEGAGGDDWVCDEHVASVGDVTHEQGADAQAAANDSNMKPARQIRRMPPYYAFR